MQAISLFLNLPKVEKPLNERQSLLKEIQCAINVERMGTKFKPITGKAVAIKTSHLKLDELYYLHSICKDARSRGKGYGFCFFVSLKVRT